MAPGFAGTQEILLGEKIKKTEDLPSIFDVIEDYRNHLRLNQAFAKLSFDTEVVNPQNEPSRPPTTLWKSPKGPLGPYLYGEMHPFRQCLYLMEHLRTPEWSPDPQIEEQIAEMLEGNPRLREIIKGQRRGS